MTLAGLLHVSTGSRRAILNAAPGSPQAIFTCVRASESTAYDCASLPVPAVVGMPIIGSIVPRTRP